MGGQGELCLLDATELASMIRSRELSAVELLDALERRAERLNPALNALVAPVGDAAARAHEADAASARGDWLGPLHGVPFTIKDSLDVGGVRTTRGSVLFADRFAAADATVVARLARAGGIPLAKTNVPEFVLWWETDNLVYGRTANPWDVDRTPGGSSGGEAAAVAAGLSPLGIGSDLGGSVRLPASYCGVVGIKPTHGRIPLTGHWPETLLRFMHVGFLARSVRDVALAIALTGGPDGTDPYALPVPIRPVDGTVAGLRVGVLVDAFGPVNAEVESTIAAAADALADAGCTIGWADVPALAATDWNTLTMALYGGGGGPSLREAIGDRWDDLSPPLRRRLSVDPPELAAYVDAENRVEALRRDLTICLSRHDVLLCPTTPAPAHPHDPPSVDIAGVEHAPRANMRATIPFDLTGSPALSLPFRFTRSGLPLAVQVVGRLFEDQTVLSIAAALERARGPLEHPPL